MQLCRTVPISPSRTVPSLLVCFSRCASAGVLQPVCLNATMQDRPALSSRSLAFAFTRAVLGICGFPQSNQGRVADDRVGLAPDLGSTRVRSRVSRNISFASVLNKWSRATKVSIPLPILIRQSIRRPQCPNGSDRHFIEVRINTPELPTHPDHALRRRATAPPTQRVACNLPPLPVRQLKWRTPHRPCVAAHRPLLGSW